VSKQSDASIVSLLCFEIMTLLHGWGGVLRCSGAIGWKELFTSLGQLCGGDSREQAAFYFKLFQTDTGTVDLENILQMVDTTTDATAEATVQLETVMEELKEKNPEGKLDLAEFQSAVADRPQLLHLFHRLLGTHSLSSSGNSAGLDGAAAQQGLRNQRESNEYANIKKLLKKSVSAHSMTTLPIGYDGDDCTISLPPFSGL